MPVCAGLKRKGGRCTATVEPPLAYCWWHDPARAEERRRNASKAGKSKPSREIVGIKATLCDLTDGVLSGRVNTGVASVANQLLNTRLRALQVEREIRETDELLARLAVVEAAAEHAEPGGQKSWGA